MMNDSEFNVVIGVLINPVIINLDCKIIHISAQHLINKFVNVNIPYDNGQVYVNYSTSPNTHLLGFILNYYGD